MSKSNIGNIIQLCNLCLPILIIFSYNKIFVKRIFFLNCLLTISSFLLLIYTFVISDFSIQTVFFNSSSIKPFIYKISASWASHEGSILLFVSMASLVNLVFIIAAEESLLKYVEIKILTLIQLLFTIFIYFTSNPFNYFSFCPSEGLGLNPMLQDVAISFHPPILYFGLVCFVTHFSFSMAIFMANKLPNWQGDTVIANQLKLLLSFSRLGLGCLTIGIGAGAWWAYRELGWGGFWFFDPVENISLLPFFSAIALHHTLLATYKKHTLVNWTLAFGILTFSLCVFGTFLVRSGLTNSIHSFAYAEKRAFFLFAVFILLALPACFLFVRDIILSKNALTNNISYSFSTYGILISCICWLVIISFLIFTLLYPIIYEYFTGNNVAIEVNFFITNFLPLFIPLLLAMGVFVTRKISLKHLYIFVIAFGISTLLTTILKFNYLSLAFITLSLFLTFQTLNILLVKTNFCNSYPSASCMSFVLGHTGCAMLVLAITLNSELKLQNEFIGKIGDKINFSSFNLTLKDIKFANGDNYYRQIAEFEVIDKNENIITLKPENRLYKIEKTLSMESDIFSYLFYDLYAVLHKVDHDTIFAYIYYQPMISFIWLSLLIIASGFLFQLFNFSKNKSVIKNSA